MKKTLTALLLAGSLLAGFGATAQEKLLAFPGAEGFGRYSIGGRGGEIYHVTNLNDSGPGSLRDAVSKSNRIVVFDVCGVINLKSVLVFKSFVTVLGQTAPGEGIQVYGDRVSFTDANHIIVRHMRFRMGNGGPSGKDTAGAASGHDMMFDHLSVLWGKDECFSISSNDKSGGPANITIQNSIIGQGLQSHSAGGLIQSDNGVTLYRNLYIENNTRNPKVKGLNQFVNNVVYNWGGGGAYIMSGSAGDSWADIENNYFIKGPWIGASAPFTRGTPTFCYYGAGNYHDSNKDGMLNGELLTVDQMKGESSLGTAPYSTWYPSLDALNQHITEHNAAKGTSIRQIPEIENKMTAAEALAWVEQYVGPVLPARDEVDQYLIDELTSYGKKGFINGISSEKQLPHKGTGVLSGGVKPLDTDGDGIPDEWEIANGLNPNDAADAAAIAANGYANIENYANSITEAYPYIKKPISLKATGATKTEITLTWDVNKNTAHGFEIETAAPGANPVFTKAATAAAGATTATLTGLQPETTYLVRLRSTDGNGLYSDYSDVVETSTTGDPTAPKASENPFPADGAREGVAGGLTLTWTNASTTYAGEVTYAVHMGESAEALTEVATGLKKCEYVTSGLEPDKTYYWRVDATNTLGTTEGPVWKFTTTAGGVLFYTDFHTQPQAWVDKYGDIIANTNLINAANTTLSVAGMTFGTGENQIRILNMPGCFSADPTKDYGPATTDDEGATAYCVQYNTTAAGGYFITPEVTGPCTVTFWLGNPETKSKTVKLYTVAGGVETLVGDLSMPNKKRVFKFTYTHLDAGSVAFKIDANAMKFDINDVLIERYVTPSGNEPLQLTAGELVNTDLSYADGSLTFAFNQDIRYNGGESVEGKTQWENITLSASGNKLTLGYEALNINSDYVVKIPAGVVTDVAGEQNFTADIKLSTADFPAAKKDGDTHWGKAATTLPMNFAPFNETAPFTTTGGLVQTSQKDYPHWVQASGSIGADAAVMTSTNDKLMTYFDPQPGRLALDIEYTGNGNPRLKIQESRNCDAAPGWRTIRVLGKADFPFRGEIALNPETRMVKLAPASIGGELKVNGMRISDAAGFFGDDYVGLSSVVTDAMTILTTADAITVMGIADGSIVNVYDLSGRLVGKATATASQATVSLPAGLYIVNVPGVKSVKVKL